MIFSPKHTAYKDKAFEYLNYLIKNQKRFELKEIRKPRTQSHKGYIFDIQKCCT